MGVYKTEPSAKASAGLQVFAPSLQLSPKPAEKPVSTRSESLPADNQVSTPTHLNTAPFSIDPERVLRKEKDQSRSARAEKTACGQSASPQLVPDDDETEPGFPVVAIFSFLPSWLISMVFHLSILVALAIMTMSDNQEKHRVVFEISEPAEQLDEMVEVIILDEVIEETPEVMVDELDNAPVTEVESFVFSEMIQEFENSDQLFANNDVPGGAALDQPQGKSDEEEGPKKKAKFFGIESEGNRFVFVIDCSGSMMAEYRWIHALEELKNSVNELEYSQEFVIYLYNHSTWAMLGVEPSHAKYLAATEKNKVKVFEWLGRARPFGNTLPAASMKYAVDLKPDAIFMLSDGEIQDNTAAWLRVWNKGEEYGGIPIHTVFLGQGAGRMLMSTIATENNGTFKWVR